MIQWERSGAVVTQWESWCRNDSVGESCAVMTQRERVGAVVIQWERVGAVITNSVGKSWCRNVLVGELMP